MESTDRTYPINEIYGPVYQGEGPQIGTKTWFVRFAGCDYDCSWCDTKYAVSPKYPGWGRIMMTVSDILGGLRSLECDEDDWVTLSGGNPALFVDEAFCTGLSSLRLAMETQGSVPLKPAVNGSIRSLVVSPKPPSSGMHLRQSESIPHIVDMLSNRMRTKKYTSALKYVAFTDEDLNWIAGFDQALESSGKLDGVERFISVGTDISLAGSIEETRRFILLAYAQMANSLINDGHFRNFRLLPQLHTLVWGQKRGI